jgi:mRNA export factor
MAFFKRPSNTPVSTAGILDKDIPLCAQPEDSISDLSWSPVSNHLAVASWDTKVRIYEVNASGRSEGKAIFQGGGPILSCHWSKVSHQSL